MKAQIIGTFVITYEVCEAAGVLADPSLAREQVERDALMLIKNELALEDWPPAQVSVVTALGQLVNAPPGAVLMDGPTGTEIITEES